VAYAQAPFNAQIQNGSIPGIVFLGDGIPKRFSVTAFLTTFGPTPVDEADAEGARVVVTGHLVSLLDGSPSSVELMDEEIASVLLPGPPSDSELEELYSSNTMESTFTLSSTSAMIAIEVQIQDDSGDQFEVPVWNVALVRASIWEGEPNIIPRIDTDSPRTFRGMSFPRLSNAGFDHPESPWRMAATTNGFWVMRLKPDDDVGYTSDGSVSFSTARDEVVDGDDILFWATERLRVSEAPTHDEAVVRKLELDALQEQVDTLDPESDALPYGKLLYSKIYNDDVGINLNGTSDLTEGFSDPFLVPLGNLDSGWTDGEVKLTPPTDKIRVVMQCVGQALDGTESELNWAMRVKSTADVVSIYGGGWNRQVVGGGYDMTLRQLEVVYEVTPGVEIIWEWIMAISGGAGCRIGHVGPMLPTLTVWAA